MVEYTNAVTILSPFTFHQSADICIQWRSYFIAFTFHQARIHVYEPCSNFYRCLRSSKARIRIYVQCNQFSPVTFLQNTDKRTV